MAKQSGRTTRGEMALLDRDCDQRYGEDPLETSAGARKRGQCEQPDGERWLRRCSATDGADVFCQDRHFTHVYMLSEPASHTQAFAACHPW